MDRHIIMVAGLIVFVTLIAMFTIIKNPAEQLRPQAVREAQHELRDMPKQSSPGALDLQKIVDDIQSKARNKADIAGTTDQAGELKPDPITSEKDSPTTDIISKTNGDIKCSSAIYSCDDFESCIEAMDIFKLCPNDLNQLDPNQNGTPCEKLCQ